MITFANGGWSFLETAKPDLRTLKVLKDADMNTQLMGYLTNCGHPGRMLAVISVGKIRPECRGTGRVQLPEPLSACGGWADRGNDLGSTVQIEHGHSWRHKPAESRVQPVGASALCIATLPSRNPARQPVTQIVEAI